MTTNVTSRHSYEIPCIIQESEMQNLYRDYLKGRNCDCELISEEGHVIKMHASVLQEKSSLISSNTSTSKNLVISLDEYCHQTIRAFVDYLYLGYDKFLERYGKANKYETNCTI